MPLFFLTGNNHLGGQDFNQRLMLYLLTKIRSDFGQDVTDPEDLQKLRLETETAKLRLTAEHSIEFQLKLTSLSTRSRPAIFKHHLTREEFETINSDLFKRVLAPISVVLKEAEMVVGDIDEIVLVGGSTRIPKVRQLVKEYFNKEPNVSVDPELAVVTGVAIQAGILSGAWPLAVSATEIPNHIRKIHVN